VFLQNLQLRGLLLDFDPKFADCRSVVHALLMKLELLARTPWVQFKSSVFT